MMPEMDGFTFIDRLRQRKERSGIPIIVVTAKELTAEERRRLEGDTDRIIQKSAFSRSALLAEVRRLVQARTGAASA